MSKQIIEMSRAVDIWTAKFADAITEQDRLRALNADLIAAINEAFPALEDAHDYISEAAGRHMRELGITTPKNKAASERMVSDLKNVEDTQAMLHAVLAKAQS